MRRTCSCSISAEADAYVRRYSYLSKLELPAGSFDLRGKTCRPTTSS